MEQSRFYMEENMRKRNLCLMFVMIMLFGFTGCKKDAPKEPEWHEGNWYEGTVYGYPYSSGQDPDEYNYEIFYSVEEFNAAGLYNLSPRNCFMLDNPKFTKLTYREVYKLADGELLATLNQVENIGSNLNSFFSRIPSIMVYNNQALFSIMDEFSYSLIKQNSSNVKYVYYFNDGTTLTFYASVEL